MLGRLPKESVAAMVFRVPVRGDRGGVALAFAGDFVRGEPIQAAREIEVLGRCFSRRHLHGRAYGIESDIRDDNFMRAGRQTGQDEAAGVVGERAHSERGHVDARALEQIAGGDVRDVAA
jgi:hypothetical protein